jgi:hypothetical protein
MLMCRSKKLSQHGAACTVIEPAHSLISQESEEHHPSSSSSSPREKEKKKKYKHHCRDSNSYPASDNFGLITKYQPLLFVDFNDLTH